MHAAKTGPQEQQGVRFCQLRRALTPHGQEGLPSPGHVTGAAKVRAARPADPTCMYSTASEMEKSVLRKMNRDSLRRLTSSRPYCSRTSAGDIMRVPCMARFTKLQRGGWWEAGWARRWARAAQRCLASAQEDEGASGTRVSRVCSPKAVGLNEVAQLCRRAAMRQMGEGQLLRTRSGPLRTVSTCIATTVVQGAQALMQQRGSMPCAACAAHPCP